MADIYLSSVDGSDSDNGTTWALAKATLAAAVTAAGAGGRVFMDHAHAETQTGNMTVTSPGTSASPVQVLCVDRTGNPEPPTAYATTGTVTTTTTGAMYLIGGSTYYYGVTFSCGTGATGSLMYCGPTTAGNENVFDTCQLGLASTGATLFINVVSLSGNAVARNRFINSTFKFGAVGQRIVLQNVSHFIGCSVDGAGSIPTSLFDGFALGAESYHKGCDYSALGSGKNLLIMSSTNGCKKHVFENCKLDASVSLTTGSITGQGGTSAVFTNCDSGDTNYRYHYQDYSGTITHEPTIVLTGGASNGTTQTSLKMVTTANAKFLHPLVSEPIVIWNETVGSSVTATIEVVTDNVTLTDAEAWIEVEYLGTSGLPLSLFASDRAASILATPANQTSSSVTWTTTGLTTPVKQKLSVAFTPQEKGPIQIRVHLAKASTTMYVDFDPDDVLA